MQIIILRKFDKEVTNEIVFRFDFIELDVLFQEASITSQQIDRLTLYISEIISKLMEHFYRVTIDPNKFLMLDFISLDGEIAGGGDYVESLMPQCLRYSTADKEYGEVSQLFFQILNCIEIELVFIEKCMEYKDELDHPFEVLDDNLIESDSDVKLSKVASEVNERYHDSGVHDIKVDEFDNTSPLDSAQTESRSVSPIDSGDGNKDKVFLLNFETDNYGVVNESEDPFWETDKFESFYTLTPN